MSKNTFARVDPPLAAFGEWREAGEDLWIDPKGAPWRDVFDFLDELGEALPETPVSLADEARGIFAACWRYGSYAHALTQGAPLPEAFQRNRRFSRLTDPEMRRIQIEFSAALAAWWELEDRDPYAAERRARAACEFLPLPQTRTLSEDELLDHLDGKMTELHLELEGEPDAETLLAKEWSVRRQANAAVVENYRNGPIESLHAGRWMEDAPGWPCVRRLYARDLQRIVAWSIPRLMTWILMRREYRLQGYSFVVARGLRQCGQWSVDLETAPVYYRKPTTV